MTPNSLLLERLQIASGFVPINMASGANAGDYVSLKDYGRVGVLFFKAAGTAGDDPTLTIQQAKDVSGTSVKALNFTDIYKKQGAALTAIGQWTKVTQSAANTYTDATSAEVQAMWWVEFKAEDLDAANDFDCLIASVGDVGTNSQIGCLLYFGGDPKYASQPSDMRSMIAN